jgi:nitroreductase
LEFFDVLGTRQAIRLFKPTAVEPEKLEAILDGAVNRAPSAGNLQAYRVYVVERHEDRQALRQVARGRDAIPTAPLVLVFCSDPERVVEQYGERGARYAVQDATIAATFAMLTATALGLASVPIGSFDDEGVRRVIRAPEGVTPVLITPIGYAAESPERRERRPAAELVYRLPE